MTEKECPICEQPYAKMAIIEPGTHWQDLYQGTVYDYFTRWNRRCSSSIDVEGEQQLKGMREAVYFHGDRRKVSTA